MSRVSTQFKLHENFIPGRGRRRLPAVLLIVLLIALAVVNSGVLAQEDGDPAGGIPGSDNEILSELRVVSPDATDSSQISGTVTSEAEATPLQNIYVCAYYDYYGDGSYWAIYNCVYTDVNGDFGLTVADSNTYRLRFSDNNGDYLTEHYDNVPDLENASDIIVDTGSTITGIDAALAAYGRITGTVTDDSSGLPIENIRACASYYNVSYWANAGCNYSDVNGDYDIGGLDAETYRLGFSENNGYFVTEYFDNAVDIESAMDIPVTLNSTVTGIDAALVEKGHITGRITTEIDSAPLEGIEVDVYYDNGYWQYVRTVYTDASGDYDVPGLNGGTHRIRFAQNVSDYVTEYYDDAVDLNSATDIPVSLSTTTTGIDTALTRNGHISGTVTAEDGGEPLQNIQVCANIFNGSTWVSTGCANTSAAGDYEITSLDAADYRVEFKDQANGYYEPEYYDDVADVESALDIAVALNSTTAGIGAALYAPPPPQNDDIGQAALIAYTPFTDTLPVRTATTAVDDPYIPCAYGQGIGSVWYTFTPISDGLLTADTSGSDYVNALAVWSGTPGSLTNIACDSYSTSNEVVDVPVTSGVTYFIQVAANYLPLGNLALHTSWTLSSPLTECVGSTGSDASVAIPDSVHIPGSFTLAPGDELALYTADGAICAGHGTWTGSSLAINAWGDDSQTAEKDGFAPGEAFRWAIWDSSNSRLYDAVPAAYQTGSGLFSDSSIHVVSRFNLSPPQPHDIPLVAGWNMISTYGEADDQAVSAILAGIVDDVVVLKNGDGQVFWPVLDIDQIGDWDVRDGYQLFMDKPRTLSIPITAMNSAFAPIDLVTGWSMVSYLGDTAQPVDQALGAISGELVLAKDGDGRVYWPTYGVNQIIDAQPGAGYQLYLDSPGTLTYP